MKFFTLPVGDNTKYEVGKTFEDYLVDIKADHFSWSSANKQLKRLLSTDLPKYICLHCFGIDKMEDGRFRFSQVSQHLSGYSKGYFNTHSKQDTIEKIRTHFQTNKGRYLDRPVKNYKT